MYISGCICFNIHLSFLQFYTYMYKIENYTSNPIYNVKTRKI